MKCGRLMIEKTLAERMHDGLLAKTEIEDKLCEVYKKYEPEIYNKGLDFDLSSDHYDNSLEVYFKISLPYPYEPCHEIRDAIYALGFYIVFWNFPEDGDDEIRGREPRHKRNCQWISCKYGYVDNRFNKKEWESKYLRKKI